MHHLRAGGHRIGDICPFAGFLKVRQSTVEHLVSRIEEVNIAYAGKISPGAGEHIVRHILAAVPHDFFHCHHKGIVDGNVPFIERLHPRLFRVVPRHFAGRYGDDMPWLRQRLALYREIMARPQVTGAELIAAGLTPDSRFRELLDYAHKLHLAGIPHDSALKQTLAYARKRK